ncbi:restriction endonuclease subunit R [Sphingomonas cavernae]|uniref:Restriction endonuclease subunit R n=2 Tax=Sphingomonas cavernae TaxID=2320861 RepID=A0A418W7X4_9SPHN|nr:restriction endonuclease subunit R [Sphingomonas cavernae]
MKPDQAVGKDANLKRPRLWVRAGGVIMASTVKIPKKTQDRIVASLRRYQNIVGKLRARDISEADTVTVIKDMLSDLFGYDKYTELTSEQQIRGTFCDLAVKVEEKIYYLAEVKAAGINLNDNHLRQAVNYGAHQGIEWIILTNAIEWRIYRIKFGQPIDYEEVFSFDVCGLSARSQDDLAQLYLLCRESISSDALTEFHKQAQILNRFVAAEILQCDAIIAALRREFRRIFDGIKVSEEELKALVVSEVLKREVVDGDPAKQAKALVKKAGAAFAKRKAAATAA